MNRTKQIFRLIALLIVWVGFFAPSAEAQTIKEFTHEKYQFLEEIRLLLTENASSDRKKQGRELLEVFEPIWLSSHFSEREREAIYGTCDLMLKKRMRAYPDFKSYLFSLVSFVSTDQPEDSFDAWQQSIDRLIEGRSRKRFVDFLDFCDNLFADNTLFSSNSTVWRADNSNYQFDIVGDEPIIIFPALKLVCYAKRDSSVIEGTSGIYYPVQNIWEGRNGTVYWSRAGFEKTQVYGQLKKYKIKTKASNFEADSVVFYNSFYFDKPLMGKYTDKVLANVTPEKASYPRFDSYNKRLRINNLFQNVDYDGGFSQQGSRFIGRGDDDKLAKVVFKRDKDDFLVITAKAFSIQSDKITSRKGAVTMYLEEDSITHPGLNFKYIDKIRQMSLVRGGDGIAQSPFFNTYHAIDMYFEAMTWNIDETQIKMHPITGSSDKSANFESEDYFSAQRFDRMLGISRVHPMVEIKDCLAERGYDRELTASDVAGCMRASVSSVRPFLMKLANQGFVKYNFDRDAVYVNDRLLDYISYKSMKKDYDVIQINSDIAKKQSPGTQNAGIPSQGVQKTSGQNATLSLLSNSFDLRIEGIKRITLSDSHAVVVQPAGGQIVMQKNRDFLFNGRVYAGKFLYFGKNYRFNYDEFKILMPNVDSLVIFVDTEKKNAMGRPMRLPVRTVIEYVNGELIIDEAGNKAGIKDRPKYPVFNSLKDSYAFYQRGGIQDGAYSRDDFYFQLEPYQFDSLDNFPNSKIKFKGTFKSAGIFPEFEDVLSLQPDYSLGFVRGTPPGGFQVYGGKGTFENDINLSHAGLRGDGVLKYLTSTSVSDNWLFLPTEVNGRAQDMVIDEQLSNPEYPPVSGTEVFEHWEPFNDFLRIETIENPIAMYDGSTIEGTLVDTPEGLTGGGLFSFEQAELESDLFDFKFNEFFSDTADFRLKAEELDINALQFSTVNVNAHVDFTERKGIFKSNGGGSYVDFPVNQYIAFMDQFTWFMDELAIELSASKESRTGGANELQFEGSRFISVHPDQDSLDFYSSAARYDLRTNIIEARNVEFISVADAFIYPDQGNVTVLKKAKMETLENAKIIANNITKYHTIYEAAIDIYAKRDYSGSGLYNYKDEKGAEQVLKFSSIRVDSIKQTLAKGFILEEDAFTLSSDYAFKGDVILHAAKKSLEFQGNTRLSHDCESLDRPWVSFVAELDPEEIYIPIGSSPQNEKKRELSAAVMLNKDSLGIYSTFLTPAARPTDFKVSTAEGFLFFDKEADEYKISSLNKLTEFNLPGNYLSLNRKTCKTYGEGKLDFGTDLGRMEVIPVGNIIHDTRDNTVAMDMMILMEFFFENSALQKMSKQFIERTDLDGVSFDRPVFSKGIYELLDEKEAEKAIQDITLVGSFRKFPEALNKALFLSDVKMRWDYESGSYKSVGGEIGVGSIQKKQIHKMVAGKLEIIKKRGGDQMRLYLELDSKTWYFFYYSRNLMQAISSDEEFNAAISEVKPDKRKMKNEKGKAPYSFMLSTKRKKADFLKDF